MSRPATGWVPQHHRDITLGRLDAFVSSDRWWNETAGNIQGSLYHFKGGAEVSLEVWSAPGMERPKFDTAVTQQFQPAKVGQEFGPSWSTHWFRVQLRVPDSWQGVPAGTPLLFVWDSGSEAMLWTPDGQPQQGLTDNRNQYVLDPQVIPGASYQVYVEMACNGVGGCGDGILAPPKDRRYKLQVADLYVPNLPAQQLLGDFLLVADMAKSLPADSAVGAKALYTANAMVNTFRATDARSWDACRQLAAGVIGQRGASAAHKVTAIGHCHIDTAWLWPFEETHRKVARAWSAQLQLMDLYPLHKFAASSAQQYAWLQADYPGLWQRLCDSVKAGRFVPVGGCWVEMDTNMPCGESLVRQMLYGQRFFQATFGQRCDTFWLPDTFGYAAQLPQLMRGAGMEFFLTQKLSWNNINVFPHNTFLWEALDGSHVITHFPPSNTYNAQVSVSELLQSCTNHRDKDRSPSSLLLFGNGDGGGGPTQRMCEAMSRVSDPEGQGVDGLVRVVQGTPSQFFNEVKQTAQDLLTWRGELYLEFHRGTYTSHAFNKASNRRCEGLLREVELLSALASALQPATTSTFRYPRDELDSLWKEVLLFQFHDVLPGSAIELVYQHTAQAYPRMLSDLRGLRSTALAALVAHEGAALPSQHAQHGLVPSDVLGAQLIDLDSPQPPASPVVEEQAGRGQVQRELEEEEQRLAGAAVAAPGGPWLFNSLHVARDEVVEVPVQLVPQGATPPQLGGPLGPSPGAALLPVHLEPLSFTPAWSHATAGTAAALQHSWEEGATARVLPAANGSLTYQLANRFVRAVFDSRGRLVSLVHKALQRELVPAPADPSMAGQGVGNRLRLYEDVPLFWDAWDVEVYHLEKGWDADVGTRVEVVENGPVRACLRLTCQLDDRPGATSTSQLEQFITLSATSPRVDFVTTVRWAADHTLLKVEFPWALQADTAAYEVQFGAVTRPTRQNTSWDWARFEVCAHKWCDLSEPDCGVALLNDCKYGHATHGGTQRLTLLKSPKAPDETTDMGTHTFRYALLPHALGWQAGGVVAAGLALNSPPVLVGAAALRSHPGAWMQLHAGKSLLKVTSLLPSPFPHSSGGPLVIDTVKSREPLLLQGPQGATTTTITTITTTNSGASSSTNLSSNSGGSGVAQAPREEVPTPKEGAQQLVVRLYEPHGCRGRALLEVGGGLRVVRAARANLLEDEMGDLPLVVVGAAETVAGAGGMGPGADVAAAGCEVQGGKAPRGVQVDFTPFQVLTVLLWVTT